MVTFEQFFILRTLTGVAVGGAFPLIYSLASDMTAPDQRALASSVITISMGMGSTLGQGVAGEWERTPWAWHLHVTSEREEPCSTPSCDVVQPEYL